MKFKTEKLQELYDAYDVKPMSWHKHCTSIHACVHTNTTCDDCTFFKLHDLHISQLWKAETLLSSGKVRGIHTFECRNTFMAYHYTLQDTVRKEYYHASADTREEALINLLIKLKDTDIKNEVQKILRGD